jgi:hypothetical protein
MRRKEEEELLVKVEEEEEGEERFLPARDTTVVRANKYKRPVGGQKLNRHPPEPPPPELINLPHIKKVQLCIDILNY